VKGLPPASWVSWIEASRWDAGTAYAVFDRHTFGDFAPYAYRTTDYGKTWTRVVSPAQGVRGYAHVVREDTVAKSLLFAGTELGLWISTDAGKTWAEFKGGDFPSAAVRDIQIQGRDNDLVVATHGRGIWIVDDITPLQQLDEKTLASDAHLFEVRPGTQWLNDISLSRYAGGSKYFRGENPPPGTAISYYLKSAPSGDVKITISDITGKVVRNLTATKEAGVNRVMWNLRADPPRLNVRPGPPGANPEIPAVPGQAGQRRALREAADAQLRGRCAAVFADAECMNNELIPIIGSAAWLCLCFLWISRMRPPVLSRVRVDAA